MRSLSVNQRPPASAGGLRHLRPLGFGTVAMPVRVKGPLVLERSRRVYGSEGSWFGTVAMPAMHIPTHARQDHAASRLQADHAGCRPAACTPAP